MRLEGVIQLAKTFSNSHPILAGWIGTTASLSATMLAWIERLDIIFRFASTCFGLLAGFMTVCLMWDRWKRWLRDKF